MFSPRACPPGYLPSARVTRVHDLAEHPFRDSSRFNEPSADAHTDQHNTMRTYSLSALAIAGLVAASNAQAHIGFSGDRNFDTLVVGVAETAVSRTVGGSFGWADGTDADLGDSHRNTYFRFVVGEASSVSISVARNDKAVDPTGLTAGAQTGAAGVLLPAFSLYRIGTGVMPTGTHDTSVASLAHLAGLGGVAKEGSFNALGDWKIYNDAGDEGDFRYIGNAADGTSANYDFASGIDGDGLADGLVSGTFVNLAAGEYFIVVGGADYGAQNTETASYGTTGTAYPTYGIAVSVTAIPEPASAAALAGLGALALVAARRSRQA